MRHGSRFLGALGLLIALTLFGCDSAASTDAGPAADSGALGDAALGDAALVDAAAADAGADGDGGAFDGGASDGGASDGGVSDPTRALFVGNSYTFYNDLPNLYRSVAESLPTPPATVSVDSSTGGGRRLVQHVTDARTMGHPLHTALNTDVSWDHVVLQEQSQIPGFPEGNAEFDQSQLAAAELSGLANMRGASVVLFMTWGRRNGDDRNMALYPDFSTMQDRLEAGYRAMAADAEAAGVTALIAPVGLAFREVYESEADPLAADALFFSLYDGDGSHPSLAGSYLAACVFAATMLDADAEAITFVPSGLDPGVASTLRSAAQAAVTAERARP